MANIIRSSTDEEISLIRVVKNIVQYYVENYYPSRFEIIKAKRLFSGDIKMMVRDTLKQENFNCDRHNLTDTIHDAFYKDFISNDYTPRAIPMHPCKRDYSDDAQDYYDWAYHVSRFERDVSKKIVDEASLIGDSYVYFGTRKEFGETLPAAYHISFFEMFVEPLASSFYDSRTHIVRKIMSTNDVMLRYNSVDWNKKSQMHKGMTNKEVIEGSIENAIYHGDFKKVYDIDSYEDKYVRNIDACCNSNVDGHQNISIVDYVNTGRIYEDLFGIKDNDSKLCEVIEVWEKTMDGYKVRCLVNGLLIPREEETEYLPFANIYFDENVGSPVHNGLGHKLMGLQNECDMLAFSLRNGIKTHVFPDWMSGSPVIDANDRAVTNLSRSGQQQVYKSKDTNFKNNQPFAPIQYIDQSVLNLIRLRLAEATQEGYVAARTNSYSLGTDGRVERLSAAFKEKRDQSKATLKVMEDSMSHALNTSYYIWLYLLKDEKFHKNLLERIDDDGELHLEDLDKKMIAANFEVVLATEGYRGENLKDLGQNILNTASGMKDLLGDKLDEEELACALASAYGLDGVKFLSKEERLDKLMKELEVQEAFEIAKLESQLKIQQRQAELMPQPEPQQQLPQQEQALLPQIPEELIQTDEFGNPIGIVGQNPTQ